MLPESTNLPGGGVKSLQVGQESELEVGPFMIRESWCYVVLAGYSSECKDLF